MYFSRVLWTKTLPVEKGGNGGSSMGVLTLFFSFWHAFTPEAGLGRVDRAQDGG